jgi:hypothetical protein
MRLLSDYAAIIIRIARILDSGRKRRSADLTPMVQALFFLVRDLEGCIIVTIELLNPHRCGVVQRTRFPSIYMIYAIYAQLVRAFPAGENFAPCGPIQVFSSSCLASESPDFRVRIEFWRSTSRRCDRSRYLTKYD